MEGIVMALQKRGKFYHYHFWVNGRRFRGSTKKTTITAARRTEALVMARAEEKGHLALARRCPLLRDFSRRFFDWVDNQSTLKEKSRVYYWNGWRLLETTDVAGMQLDAICQDDAGALAFSGGPSNRNNALRTLRRMLGKAQEWGVLKAVPRIKLGQEHQRERIIDEQIEAQLLPFCKQPLRDVLMIMRDTGLRNQKEVFAMRWEHVDWANRRYFVYDSKTPKGRRHVPISPRVKDALLRRYSGQKGG
jgi:integrase